MKLSQRTEKERKRLGKRGERLAATHLKKKGMRILEKNYRTPVGEIDIIATHNEELIFVEVKTRTSTEFGWPEEAVTHSKQNTIRRVAWFYLRRFPDPKPSFRFDIISILEHPQTRKYDLHHLENAF